MRYQKVALSIALSCTLVGTLSACSDDGSSTNAADASSPATVIQTVKESKPPEAKDKPKPQPTRKAEGQEEQPRKKPGKQCGDLSAQEALAQNVGKLDSPKGTDWTWCCCKVGAVGRPAWNNQVHGHLLRSAVPS